MEKFQYIFHLLLNHRYKVLINILFLISFSFILNSNNYIYCMNDNPNAVDIPMVAEAKEPHRPSQQMLAIKREIMTYAGGQAHFIEQIDEQTRAIAEQKAIIAKIQRESAANLSQIRRLEESVEGYSIGSISIDGYKGTITKLEDKIANLERELHISQTLLAEAKRDKERLYSMISDVLKKR